jgi:cytoskeletal protein CcmA (bactofilin family)
LSSKGPAARNRTSASKRGDFPRGEPIEQSPTGAPPTAKNGSDGEHRSVVLGPRDRLVGQLYIEGDLRVIGTVEGELEVTGSVEIDEGGRVTGPVTARDRLVVGRAGSLKGDVRVARLIVQDGATFSGNVSMGKAVEAPPKPIEPAKELEPAKPPDMVNPPQVVKPPQATKPPQTKAKRR